MKRIILFLIRRKLGVKKCELFYFKNQKSYLDRYYISSKEIIKISAIRNHDYFVKRSNISVNWILSGEGKKHLKKGGFGL